MTKNARHPLLFKVEMAIIILLKVVVVIHIHFKAEVGTTLNLSTHVDNVAIDNEEYEPLPILQAEGGNHYPFEGGGGGVGGGGGHPHFC